MGITSGLLRTIAWEELRHGRKPEEIHVTQSILTSLKDEVACGFLLETHSDEITFAGVKLVVID